MDPAPFIAAETELRGRIVGLLDTLSSVRALADLNIQHRDVRTLLAEALHVLSQYQDLERCSVYLLEGDRLVYTAGTDVQEVFLVELSEVMPRSEMARRSFRVGEGVIGVTAQTGELQYCPNCASDSRFAADSGRVPGSLLCAPIRNSGSLLGVLNASYPEPEYFEDWHRHMLTMFSSVLGHMLASHHVVQRLEAAVVERTRQLEAALSEAQRLQRRYEELSTVDELTGLHNRRFFFAEADAALARGVRYQHPFCLTIMDLDHFKWVNDTHGHATGDQVLKGLASALLGHSREGDILARLGGEEFVLALPNTSLTGARALSERIRRHVKELRWDSPSGEVVQITISIGVSCIDLEDPEVHRLRLDDLLRQADEALYYCKYNGRDQVQSFPDIQGAPETPKGD